MAKDYAELMGLESKGTIFSYVAVSLSALGLLIPPLAVAGLILGLVAIKRAPTDNAKRIARVAIGVSSVGLVVLGVLTWKVMLPRPPSAAVECQVGLAALSLAQEAHRKTRGRYAASSEELGIPVASEFFLDAHGEHTARLVALGVGPTGQCPACNVTMACLESPGRWWTVTSGEKPKAQR